MSEYVKLVNNLQTLKLEKISERLDSHIDLVNSGTETFVSALLNLTNEQIKFKQTIAEGMMIKIANFPFVKTFDDFDFSFQPSLKRDEFMDLKSMRFMEKNENLLFLGSPGVGKTHLAISIGIEAAINRFSTYFISCNDLIAQLKKAKAENRLQQRIKHFTSISLLIIDEVGFLPISEDDSSLFFQLIAARYEKHSTIITTNKAFSKWPEVFKEPVIAGAILDRLLHHSKVFNIVGPSYRLKDLSNYFQKEENA